MTTDADQQTLIPRPSEAAIYERALALQLERLSTWTRLPDERTDWELETLLDELAGTARALRALRGDADLPF